MALQFVVKFIWGHGPRLLGKLFDKRILLNFGGGESFDETEFTLVVKVESAGAEMENDAGLFVREICREIVAGVAGGETIP